MSQPFEKDDYSDFDDDQERSTKVRGRSQDYEKKRRRAERILEQARIRDLLGYDVDYND